MSGNSSSDIWIAGAVAAFTVDLIVYPLDTLKTRIQSPDYKRLFTNEATNTLKKAALFRGLYQGVGTVILATLPSSGAFFTTYERSKQLLSAAPLVSNLPTPVIHSAASGIAELVSCAILTPAEVIKQNAQMVTEASVAETKHSATRQVLQRFKSNPLALWRGYGALAGRNLPHTAIQFPLFERFKVAITKWRREQISKKKGGAEVTEQDIPIYENGIITAVAAGSGGAFAAVVTTPIDVVKTRIMLQAASSFAGQGQDAAEQAKDAIKQGKIADALGETAKAAGKGSATKKPSSLEVARQVIKDQGWYGLWRGGALRGAWTFLGAGLYLGVYESGKTYLARRRGESPDEDDD